MPPTLILIRHAEALHNATHKSRPSPDIPLWYPFTISPTNPLQQNYEIPDPRSRSSARSNAKLRQTLRHRHPLPTISAEFPTLDFSTVDPLYPAKTTPNNPYAFTRRAVLARGTRALKNLKHRPEKVIAVVSHSGFLRTAVCKTHFANADYRVFEFAGDEEEGEGVKSEKGRADVTESDFPIEKVEEEMGGKVAGEAAREVPKK
ncbi:hypothetical protein H2199_003134 [Coniosporium tulheliwenetii]|uniref:Uncharacterized protein n=1 Tax=Coniosporium tulheliwenetii TaxID=3383036 RepID=A0ACC2ZCX5_9PEZI|nr:hypothetical protein H2199_003134 [Cladosporium sp. JES 115]